MGVNTCQRRTLGAPDGGWGWMVVLSSFVVTGFSYAFPKAISVYFKELMSDFGVGYSDTAWISSIMLAMLYGSGPLCSIMLNRFGCRPVMLFGGLLASAGMVSASFTTGIIQLYLTAGVITGVGLALNFQPSLVMLGSYFERRRPLANGLAAAGSPVFLSALSPLGQLLLDGFGWRGGFLIMGALLLNCCICGALMRPLEEQESRRRKRREAKRVPQAQELKKMMPTKVGQEEKERAGREDSDPPGKKRKKKLLDISVLHHKNLVIYIVAKFIVVLGLFVPTILLVNYAKDQGIRDHEAAFLLSIIGFVDIVARPTCGLVAGLKWVRPHMTYFFGLALLFNGLTSVCSARSTSYLSLVVFCIFFGLSYGMVGALQFEVLMGIVGTRSFASALGLVLLVEAVAVLIGPPSAGRLVDAYKNYELIFYMAGAELITAAVFLCSVSYCCIDRANKHGAPAREETTKQQEEEEQLQASDRNVQGGVEHSHGVAWIEDASDARVVDREGF